MLGLGATGQNAIGQAADGTAPVPVASWFRLLSEPVRFKPGVLPAQQQFFAYVPNPTTVTPFAWFAPLSEPVRFKPALLAALQQFYAADTSVIPVSKLIEWFAPLSEPPRFKPGLLAALQQFLAAPSQLRPNPNITAVLNALETKDTFLGGVSIFNRIASGEFGIIESKTTGNEIGVNPVTIARASIAITIL